MGLDMYAYVATREGQQREYYDGAEWDETTKDLVNTKVNKPREIAYWRKHPNLHGWMQRLWVRKTNEAGIVDDNPDRAGEFNGVELELTWEDLEQLEQDIRNKNLPNTSGFFFGSEKDDEYREHDLKFVREAKAEAFLGLRVFYNSSW